ncbi:MAG TPA: hypothetical protein VFB32_05370 [Rudaea sp.]|nr:hypothetical protein [Rudaea sp.]
MKRALWKWLGGLALVASSTVASAYSPSPGLWWNPNESGRGYNIDIQDGALVVTAYVYTASGAATWFIAAGPFDTTSTQFSAQLGAFSGGQCFGCTYSAATGVAEGTLTIKFTSPETGILYFPGGSTPIEHEIYGYSDQMDYLYGEWAFNMQIGSQIDAQWVVFNSTYTGTDGTPYISGTEDGVNGTAALGTFVASPPGFVVSVVDTTGNTHTYAMPVFDDRRMLGDGALEPPGVLPSSYPNVAAGNRLLFRSDLVTAKKLEAPDTAKLPALEEVLRQRVQALTNAHVD